MTNILRHLHIFAFVVLSALAVPARAQFPQAQAIGAFEGVRRNLESVIRAAGQANSNSNNISSPAVDSQTAKSMSYDNQIKATNTYFQKRQLNRTYREAERGQRLTRADHERISRSRAPDRLNSSQFDSYTGRINWPVVLKENQYRQNRARIDHLYVEHIAAGGGINTYQYADIKALTSEMRTKLRTNLKNMPPEQYTYARKFLVGLQYEARFPAGS